jgi:hypothetical protein
MSGERTRRPTEQAARLGHRVANLPTSVAPAQEIGATALSAVRHLLEFPPSSCRTHCRSDHAYDPFGKLVNILGHA